MLTSSKKNETAVHGCNPVISVLVVLVSHKVYFLCSTISLAVLFVIDYLMFAQDDRAEKCTRMPEPRAELLY